MLRYGRKSRQVELPVRLSVAFTEVGTLELWCESQVSDHRWRVQFQLRSRRPELEASRRATTASRHGDGDAADVAEAIVAEDRIDGGRRGRFDRCSNSASAEIDVGEPGGASRAASWATARRRGRSASSADLPMR